MPFTSAQRGGHGCTICADPNVEAIDAAIKSGAMSRSRIANQFGVSESAVQRHKELLNRSCHSQLRLHEQYGTRSTVDYCLSDLLDLLPIREDDQLYPWTRSGLEDRFLIIFLPAADLIHNCVEKLLRRKIADVFNFKANTLEGCDLRFVAFHGQRLGTFQSAHALLNHAELDA